MWIIFNIHISFLDLLWQKRSFIAKLCPLSVGVMFVRCKYAEMVELTEVQVQVRSHRNEIHLFVPADFYAQNSFLLLSAPFPSHPKRIKTVDLYLFSQLHNDFQVRRGTIFFNCPLHSAFTVMQVYTVAQV